MKPRNLIARTKATETAKPGTSRRCRVARECGNGTQFRGEIGQLLHGRLRVVTLVTLVPFGLILLRNLTVGHQQTPTGPVGMWLQGIVTLFLAGTSLVLWQWPCLSLAVLRKIELTLFGTLAVYFSWMQLNIFGNEALHGLATIGPTAEVARLQISHRALR